MNLSITILSMGFSATGSETSQPFAMRTRSCICARGVKAVSYAQSWKRCARDSMEMP